MQQSVMDCRWGGVSGGLSLCCFSAVVGGQGRWGGSGEATTVTTQRDGGNSFLERHQRDTTFLQLELQPGYRSGQPGVG